MADAKQGHGDSALTEAEKRGLVLAFLLARDQEGGVIFEEAEANIVLNWASGVRAETTMLDLVIAGKARVGVVDGELRFWANSPAEAQRYGEIIASAMAGNKAPASMEPMNVYIVSPADSH